MNVKSEDLEFSDRDEYRNWLKINNKREHGIWLIFIKGNKSFTANDALEESICFGWIDGLMKSIDDTRYKKYFSRRKDAYTWSEKNMRIFEKMVQIGSMTEAGIEVFKKDPTQEKSVIDIDEKIQTLRSALQESDGILMLFDKKAPSIQKRFALFYCDAKTEETRNKRIDTIVEALIKNYKGMLY